LYVTLRVQASKCAHQSMEGGWASLKEAAFKM